MFVINPFVTLDIMAFNGAGSSLNSKYKKITTGDNSGLKTASKYVKEDADIKTLIQLYIQLVEKDAKDFHDMVKGFELMDSQAGRILLQSAKTAKNVAKDVLNTRTQTSNTNGNGGGGGGSF